MPASLRLIRIALFLLAITSPRLLAINVGEGADFPNLTAGAPFTLTNGTNTFSGSLTTPNDFQDRFDVTVPPGKRITGVTKMFNVSASLQNPSITFNTEGLSGTGSGTFVNGYPLGVGTYSAIAGADVAVGATWTVTITLGDAPNYRVNTSGGFMFVTDDFGNADTLTVSQPAAGTIKFAAPGRTFSVNGGALISGDSGNVTLTSVTDIQISASGGEDVINVGAFTGTFPSLTINGGAGEDTVNFNGDLTFASGKDLYVNDGSSGAEAVNLASGTNLVTSGTGTIAVSANRIIKLLSGSSLETVNGDLDVEANQQATVSTGNFIGVNLDGAGTFIRSTGTGMVTVKGRGGNDAAGSQLGILVINGAKILGGSGAVSVTGTGGASTNIINRGVTVYGSGSQISSSSGAVSVTGVAGSLGSFYGIGISVLFGGEISAGGVGTVTVNGTGAGASGSGYNMGLEIGDLNAKITSAGGAVTVIGTAGTGISSGLFLANSALISTPVAGGNLLLEADSMSIDGTSSVSTLAAASTATIQPRSATTRFSVGGADDNSASPKVLGLTDAELDRITTTNLILSTTGSGPLSVSAPVSPALAANLTLKADAATGSILPTSTGTDMTVSGTLKVDGPLTFPITSLTPESGFSPLKVVGAVNLNSRVLSLTGTTFAGATGNTFTLIENDGTDAVTGTFSGLAEGAYLAWPTSTTLKGRISYIGGTGNDVMLTLVDPLKVSTILDSGTGSLREALAYAATKSGPDVITLDATLPGQSIDLASELVINDAAGVTLDASSAPNGLSLGAVGTHRLVHVLPGSTVDINRVTFIGGKAFGGFPNSYGGGLYNEATLYLTDCTFALNQAFAGAGIFNASGSMTLNRCTFFSNSASYGGCIQNEATLVCSTSTFSGNTATQEGGVISSIGGRSVSLTHCTLSGNTSNSTGGGIHCGGTLTITNSIIAGNSAPTGADIYNLGTLTRAGKNIVQVLAGGGSSSGTTSLAVAPQLGALQDYGGPTQTRILLAGSPARNASVSSTATTDQRGAAIEGVADIGAYESGSTGFYEGWIYETLPVSGNPAVYDADYDYDADGQTNYQEWLANTVPSDATSVFKLVSFTRVGSNFHFVFTTRTGRNYTLWSSDALSGWTSTGLTVAGNNANLSIDVPVPNASVPKRFYQIKAGP